MQRERFASRGGGLFFRRKLLPRRGARHRWQSFQADRDSGKAVDANGRLSFHAYSTSRDIRLKLIDASGNQSTDVRLGDYEDHCFFNDCDVDVPLSALTRSSFNFSQVQSFTVFVDSRVAAGSYSVQIRNVVFRTSGDPIDVESDPANCGGVGHSCLGGACVLGACNPTPVTALGDLHCAASVAANDSYVYVGDSSTPPSLVRFNVTGGGKTTLLTGNSFFPLLRDGGQLFWSDSTYGLLRLDDGQTAATTIYGTPVGQLSLTGETVVSYDSNNSRYVSVDRDLSGPGSYSVITNTSGLHPAASAATSTYLYVLDESSGSVIYRIDRTTGARLQVSNAGDSISGITAYGDAVYWNYRDSQGNTGIRSLSSAPGSTVQQAVNAVPSNQSVGNPTVDASGIYHSLYDGTNTYYYRTPLTNPAEHDIVSRSGYLPNSDTTSLNSSGVVYLNGCSLGGGGTVQLFAKP